MGNIVEVLRGMLGVYAIAQISSIIWVGKTKLNQIVSYSLFDCFFADSIHVSQHHLHSLLAQVLSLCYSLRA